MCIRDSPHAARGCRPNFRCERCNSWAPPGVEYINSDSTNRADRVHWIEPRHTDAQQANDLREAQHVPDSHASSKPCSVSTDSTIRGDRNQAASTAIPFPAALDPHAPVMSSHCWCHRKYLQTDSRHRRSISATTREDTQYRGV